MGRCDHFISWLRLGRSSADRSWRIRPGATVDAGSLTLAAHPGEDRLGTEAAAERFDALEFNIYPSTWPVTVTDGITSIMPGDDDHVHPE